MDQASLRAGVARLRIWPVVNGRPLALEVVFPDLYPYFRFEIAAPAEQLPYHQHPLSGYLCLLGRSTHYWSPEYTVAELVQEQVPKVFATAASRDRAAVAGQEEQQAEPYGDYYSYAPGMVLIQSGWDIPPGEQSGPLVIGTVPEAGARGDPLLQGAVLELLSNRRTPLARVDARLRAVYTGPSLRARWLRLDAPLREFDPARFFEQVRARDPGRNNNPSHPFNGGRLQVWGVLFPEEVGWRTPGEGWLFVCRFERDRRPGIGRVSLGHKVKQKETEVSHYFARAGRGGPADVRLRTPELDSLPAKKVAVFGLGCVGAPSALALARAGVGELRLLDNDIVDPGTVGRWPVGLSAVGRKKVTVLQDVIRRDYPYTRVVPYDHRLGATRGGQPGERSDEEVLRKVTEGAALIYDAAAEIGVQHLLSDWARELDVPYVGVVGTFGGWGGKIVRIDPARTEGCWLCYQHACNDGTIPAPPAAPDDRVQPPGCGDPTFTGAGFDLEQVALTAVREAASTLCAGQPGGYPPADWDVLTIAFRDDHGKLIAPRFQAHQLKKHPGCPRCNHP